MALVVSETLRTKEIEEVRCQMHTSVQTQSPATKAVKLAGGKRDYFLIIYLSTESLEGALGEGACG